MVFRKKYQTSIVLALPVIIAIASTTQNYFTGIGPGDIRMLIILLFMMLFFYKYYRDTAINHIIMIDIFFLFLVAIFATDLSYTFTVLAKYIVSTLAFSVGYYYIKNINDYQGLLKSYLWALLIMDISIVVANIFQIGSSDYLEASAIYYGPARVDITMQMSVILLALSPYFLFVKTTAKQKLFITILLLASFIFILLGIKRTAIASLVIGYFIYLYIFPTKIKQIGKYIGVLVVLLLASPLYIDILYQRYLARLEAGRFDIGQASTEEGRFIEVVNVIDQFIYGDIWHKLFGSELFNYMEFAKTDRMLHTDYATMFSGSGLIGLILFLLIYVFMFKKIIFYKKVFKKNKLMISIVAVSLSLLVAEIILGVGSTVHGIGIRFYIFLFIGASLGILTHHHNHIKKNRRIK